MKPSTFFLVLICSVLFATGLSADPVYTLDSGDKIKVTVFEEKDLSDTFEVSSEGDISMPLIGNVYVKGKTLKEVKESITNKFLDGFLKNPRVGIEVLNYRPFYILGEVNEPGSYPYVNGMTALNAIALGGGFTYRADKEDLILIRANDPEQKKISITPDTKVFPGDVVRVEERLF
ncbi:polysaccharide biosynthesis/export family protein [Terasakiella pusilla]|uniref:polysaccharide biosynthesis/export family protein n=1 Tax=Terasakiella pusilla TaxID=64973 RepID=UPI003AA99D1B